MRLKRIQTHYKRFKDKFFVACKTFYGASRFDTLVLLIALTAANNAYSQSRCSDLFSDEQVKQVETASIDLSANINAYKAGASLGRKVWDKATMGVLAELYDLVQNPQSGRNEPVLDKKSQAEVEARTKKILEEETASVKARHLEIISRIVKISRLTNDTQLVSVKNYTVGDCSPELEQAIKNYFNSSYIKLVNWVYRLYNLEKNDPASSAVMMDEVAAYAVQRVGFEFNLIYDNKILEKHLQRIAKVIDEYESATNLLMRERALSKLEVEIPLMPVGGVTVAVQITSPKNPVELKRYFKNELEDPLDLINVKVKDEFKLRHAMLYNAIEALPPTHPIEIHAHTRAHVKAYAKLGFVDTGLIVNPKYPDVEIHLLKATREQALQSIKAILDGLE